MTQLARANPISLAQLAQQAAAAVDPHAWRALVESGRRDRPLEGLDGWRHAAMGRIRALVPKTRRYLRQADRVLAMRDEVRCLGSNGLGNELRELREIVQRSREEQRHRIRAVSLAREVARRELGLEPYRVQVAAALASLDGNLIEMATGEGKSLTAAIIAAIAGFRGSGVHLMTTNDYLASRDAEHFRAFYRAMGVSVGSITAESEPAERRAAYRADVTYLTNQEAAADFLRDRVALGQGTNLDRVLLGKLLGGKAATSGTVQRGLEHAIVDEADSILIDEAVTPLILSGEAPLSESELDNLRRAASLAQQLDEGEHYRIDAKHRDVEVTRSGKRRLAELSGDLSGLWRSPRIRLELVSRALSAEHLFKKDHQYVVQDGKVVIVDEGTGRLMPDRSWRDGLHQAVEVKEGLEVTPNKQTLARVSFQRFFRKYKRLTGMTGTAMEARAELWQVYNLPTVRIPTNRARVRRDLLDRVFRRAEERWDAVAAEVRRVHATGRPILVGTRSVEASLLVSERLQALGLNHELINAVNHAREAQIVAQAGRRGAITVATNMAGRGTDIKLQEGVRELGGLHVIATERNESDRVDRQLFGRAGRQGDPGSAQAFVSLEDELIKRHARKSWRGRLCLTVATRRAFRLAQQKAGASARRARKGVLKQDQWLSDQLGFAGIEN